MAETLENWLVENGISVVIAGYLSWLVIALAMILLAFISNYIAKKFLLTGQEILVNRGQVFCKKEPDDLG